MGVVAGMEAGGESFVCCGLIGSNKSQWNSLITKGSFSSFAHGLYVNTDSEMREWYKGHENG